VINERGDQENLEALYVSDPEESQANICSLPATEVRLVMFRLDIVTSFSQDFESNLVVVRSPCMGYYFIQRDRFSHIVKQAKAIISLNPQQAHGESRATLT
jgi:hypothetical protein